MRELPDGWLTAPEARHLRQLAEGRRVLELGAWKGRSTVVLAETAAYVVSVDRHQGIPGHGQSLDEYLANVRDLENVAVVVARFADICAHLQGFGMVYVDGDHEPEPVAADTALAVALEPDVIAYHDWDIDTVRETVLGILGRPDSLVGSVAAFRL